MSDYEDQQLMRFIILSQEAGGIIGKKGSHIRQIRDETSCTVNISGSSANERVLNVTGKPSEIKEAIEIIAKKLKEMSETGGQSRGKFDVTMRLLVPNSQCGCIIGKLGANVKAIREESGATITIPTDSLCGSTERSVTIAGEAEGIAICCERIAEKFLEFPARSGNVQFMPTVFMQGSTVMPQMSAMSGQLHMGGLSRRSEQKIRLPSNVIGSLIGKAGCHINEIRQFSGATVQIEESKRDERLSDVTVAGTPEAVSCATFLINARISAGREAARNNRRQDRRQQNDEEHDDE